MSVVFCMLTIEEVIVLKDAVFKLSDNPEDLSVALDWIIEKKALIKKQREIRDRAKARLKPLLEEAARNNQQAAKSSCK